MRFHGGMSLRSLVLVCVLGMVSVFGSFAAGPEPALIIKGVPGMKDSFIRGADISSLAQVEEVGGTFTNASGQVQDALQILKDSGVNWVRLRLWHTPVNDLPVIEGGKVISNKGQRVGGGNNDLDRTIQLATRAKALGFKVLLDFHYSDFWADPGKQKKPAAWKQLGAAELAKAVHAYTKDVLARMAKAKCLPDMVQVGNETNNGMLWPEGKIWAADASEKVGGPEGFANLLKQAIRAVRDQDPSIRIAIHLADGGNNGLYRSVIDPLVSAGVDFDIIGLSYYNYWHGSLAELSANLKDLASRYRKDLIVMETAYAWTNDDADDAGNVFQVYNSDEGGYLPTVQGQATVVRDVMATVVSAAGSRGLGVFYWEPAWIPVPGAGWRTGEGNSWDNQAMFDAKGRALPSLSVFSRVLESPDNVTIVPLRTEPLKLTVTVGDTVTLPARVKTIMSDDSWVLSPVTWDELPAKFPDQEAVLQVKGRLAGGTVAALAEITFTRTRNLIADPSFETGNLDGWTLSDPQKASKVENNASNAKTGKYTFKYWLDKPFQILLTRTFTNIPNGTYVFTTTAMGGGGEKSIKVFARDFGSGKTLSVQAVNTGWKKWADYSIPAIEVTNNQCTIGIFIDAAAGNWGNFDDVGFWLQAK